MKWHYLILLLFIIPVANAYTLSLTFVDEDTNTLLENAGLAVLVNSTSCTITNGTCIFDAGNNSTAFVSALATGYATREYSFGRDVTFGDVNKTLTLLKDVDGTSIQFKLRDVAGDNFITDGNLTILHQANNYIAGRFQIGSDSLFTAFLSPFDQNYTFIVEYSGSDFNFIRNFLTVKLPKDEDTIALITPYDVKIRNIGANNVSNTSVEQPFRVFPYTVPFYIADVNANDYFGRGYYFRLSRSDFDQNIILQDDFTGADTSAPDASKWLKFISGADANVDIAGNDLNFYSPGSSKQTGVFSDLNLFFEIGDSFIFEWITNDRPTSGGGSEQFEAGFIPDTNQNAVTSNSKFSISRTADGILQQRHLGSTDSSQGDAGTGIKKLTIKLERTGNQTYQATYFINDTNQIGQFTETVITHTWKVVMYVRAGSGAGEFVAGKITDAKLFESNAFEIQPYLAKQTESNQVSVKLRKIFKGTEKLAGIRILSETDIEGAGSQEVETVVTDAQGQAVMSFLTDGTPYTLSLFDSSDNLLFIREVKIAPNQFTLSISAEDQPLFDTIGEKRVSVAFTPDGGTVASKDVNVIARVFYDVNVTVVDVNLIIQQNDFNLSDLNANHFITTSPFDTNISIDIADLNINTPWTMIVNVRTQDGNSYFIKASFNLPRMIGGKDFINGVLRGDFKTGFGCNADDWLNICPFTFFMSLFFSVVFSAAALAIFGSRNPNVALILFIGLLGLATYFYWVPAIFFIGLVSLSAITLFALTKVGG